MKRILALSTTLLLAQAASALAKSYSIEQIHIDARVLANGGLRIEEAIGYQFEGSYSFGFREIPLKSGQRIENVQVREGSNRFVEGREEAPGSFEVSFAENRVRITWRFKAANERRTFNIAYTVYGAVHRYPDVAELYYKFVGEEWEKSIGRVSVRVQFVEGMPAESIRAWAHGPLYGTVELTGKGVVLLNVSPLPRNTFWEGRIVFAPSALSGVPLSAEEPALERILAEEAAWAEDANRRRQEEVRNTQRRAQLRAQWLPLVVLSAFVGAGFWSYLFIRFGKPHPVRQTHVPGEVPSLHPPPFIEYLMHRSFRGAALVATLVDLARRGCLRITEKVTEKSGWFRAKREADYRFELTGEPAEHIQGFEVELMDFMLRKAGDGRGFWLSDLKENSRKNRSEFFKWFKGWQKRLEDLVKKENFFEPYRLGALLPNILCGLMVITTGIVFIAVTESPIGALPIVAGALQAIFSVALTRRTEQGQQLWAAWKGYRDHIKSISRSRGPVSLTSREWENYIVPAILFGLHQKLCRVMEVSADGDSATLFPWFAMSSQGGRGEGLAGLGSGISSMVTSVSSTMSSASGMGGGASAGGGGSGGGGGGAG